MSERKPIGITTPYRKVVQQTVEQQLAVLQKKLIALEQRVKELEAKK